MVTDIRQGILVLKDRASQVIVNSKFDLMLAQSVFYKIYKLQDA